MTVTTPVLGGSLLTTSGLIPALVASWPIKGLRSITTALPLIVTWPLPSTRFTNCRCVIRLAPTHNRWNAPESNSRWASRSITSFRAPATGLAIGASRGGSAACSCAATSTFWESWLARNSALCFCTCSLRRRAELVLTHSSVFSSWRSAQIAKIARMARTLASPTRIRGNHTRARGDPTAATPRPTAPQPEAGGPDIVPGADIPGPRSRRALSLTGQERDPARRAAPSSTLIGAPRPPAREWGARRRRVRTGEYPHARLLPAAQPPPRCKRMSDPSKRSGDVASHDRHATGHDRLRGDRRGRGRRLGGDRRTGPQAGNRRRPKSWLLYQFGADARDVEGDAMTADAGFRARHATSFDRVAVVSDEDWLRPAVRALSFLLPGSAKAFHVRDLEAAKAWLVDDR